MPEPLKSDETPIFSVVQNARSIDAARHESDVENQTSFSGGGGRRGGRLKKFLNNNGSLLILLFFGFGIASLSFYALAVDPATATYMQPFHRTFLGECRVWIYLLFLAAGCGCFFTAISALRAHFDAQKVENDPGGRLRSIRSKRLEKLPEGSIASMVTKYILALVGYI